MGAAQRLQKWIWILIYGGMFLVALGLAMRPGDPMLGWGMAALGAVLIGTGVCMIWARSRIEDNPEPKP